MLVLYTTHFKQEYSYMANRKELFLDEMPCAYSSPNWKRRLSK